MPASACPCGSVALAAVVCGVDRAACDSNVAGSLRACQAKTGGAAAAAGGGAAAAAAGEEQQQEQQQSREESRAEPRQRTKSEQRDRAEPRQKTKQSRAAKQSGAESGGGGPQFVCKTRIKFDL